MYELAGILFLLAMLLMVAGATGALYVWFMSDD